MTPDELHHLVEHLRSLPRESEWLEFKHNNSNPQEIGEYISALSNGAALHRQGRAYLIWGIEDGTQNMLGTTFRPRRQRVGNEELENWLLRLLNPRIDFGIHEGNVSGKSVVLLEIQPATLQPVAFAGVEYIRVGTYKKKLRDYPEKERALWALFSERPFEAGIAVPAASSDDVLSLIDYAGAFRLLGTQLPDNRQAILHRLTAEKLLVPKPGERFDITNVGASSLPLIFADSNDWLAKRCASSSTTATTRPEPSKSIRTRPAICPDQGMPSASRRCSPGSTTNFRRTSRSDKLSARKTVSTPRLRFVSLSPTQSSTRTSISRAPGR